MKKIFLIMFCMILLAGSVSAGISEWDNKISYEDNDLRVNFKNSFLGIIPTSDIGTIELKSHSSVDEVLKFGFGAEEVVMYYDFTNWELYEDGLGDVSFVDMNTGKEIKKDYYFVEWVVKNVEVNDYKEICQLNLNGTNVCNQEIVGTHLEKKWSWERLENRNIENKRIGLKTYVDEGDYIDAVWTIAGKKIKRHAEWTADLNVGIVGYYTLDEATGDAIDEVSSNDGTVSAIQGVTGKINNAYNFTGGSNQVDCGTGMGTTMGDGVSEVSVSLWFKADVTGDNDGLFTLGDFAGSQGEFTIVIQDNLIKFKVDNSVIDVTYGFTDTASFHHLVAVYNGSAIILYVDNVVRATADYASTLDLNGLKTIIGGYYQAGLSFDGIIDEVGIWERTLTATEVTQLYNEGNALSYELGLSITLNTPTNHTNSSTNTITFNCSASDDSNLINVSLILDGVVNETNSSGINNAFYYFTKNLADGDTYWSCRGANNETETEFITAGANLLSVDTINPEVEILAPLVIVNHHALNTNISFNWSANDTNLDSCVYEYEGVNTTVTCSDNTTNINITNIVNRTITFYVNDTSGRMNSTIRTWEYRVFEEEKFYEGTYETASSTFVVNISTTTGESTSAELFWNGVGKGASTKTGTDTNANFSNTIQIPTGTGLKEFVWQLTVGSTKVNTTATNQIVGLTQFGLCNATLTQSYINFTFIDEETLSSLNATIDSSTWSYWLGDGTNTKSLLFSNNSLNDFYTFCLNPPNQTLYNTRSIQYASTGYPQRKYDASSDLTNTTTSQILYLLSSADGIYSTIQVVDQDGDKISDIEVTAERQFSGVWTVIGQETTDDAGLVTFWLNPDYDHKFTFAGDSCTGTTVTIRPTQTQYTQQLQCGVSDEIYVSQIEGIKYARTPATGIVQAATYNFSYQIVSSKENLVNVSMQIVSSSDGTVLNSTDSTCSPGGCTIWVMHIVSLGDDIKGKYYFDIGNGTTLLEGDARWRCIDIPTAGKAGILTFIKDMKYVIDEWGDDSDTSDFNRIVVVFFFMCLAISALNYQFGNDTQNPGAFLIIMTFVILMGSLSGSFVGGEMTGQGFFYFNNLSGNDFINNYILLGFTLIITISYFLNANRQAQR